MENKEKNTKEKILEEALKLFAQSGYMGTSMNEIALRLGVTKAALYKHYSSKQEILEKIVEQMNRMDYERAAEYEMPETEPDGFAEALKLCNKHGESQVMIDEIYPYHEREHRQGAHLLRHVRQADSCEKGVAEAAI